MEVEAILAGLIPSWSSVVLLSCYLGYLAVAGSVLPGKIVPGALLSDGSRLHYRCNGPPILHPSSAYCIPESVLLIEHLIMLFGITFAVSGTSRDWYLHEVDVCRGMHFLTVIADKGLELLSATFIFSLFVNDCSLLYVSLFKLYMVLIIHAPAYNVCFLSSFQVSLVLYAAGLKSRSQSSSLKPHVTGDFIHDWWFGVQLNPHFLGIDLKFFFVRAGMMGWLLINLSLLAKNYEAGTANLSVILYQLFCTLYVLDYFFYEEFMTSTWDIIAEKLGFMLVFGDLVFIPFTFSIQGWWLLKNKVELMKVAAVANCLVFLVGLLKHPAEFCSYRVFRGANKQKHIFKKDPKAPIWGKAPKVIGGKLLASGYWGIARHCNYLGDLLLALSFSLPCGISSAIPYFYPTYLLILLIWRERRDEARCSQKYKEIWAEYCQLVPWRILPYVY
ncbi:unnamed protein product [Musa banksii]